MTTNRRFSQALQALTELKTESTPPPQPMPAAPSLRDVLAEIGSLPREAMFLGIATDGLPVLLNLHNPHPGPVLLAGEAGSGKTAFIQTIAQSIAQTHRSDDVQYGVVTSYPDEWDRVEESPHRVGIFPIGHNSTRDFIHSLATWAHANKNTHQCVLLLIDDLESLVSLELEAMQDFRWLLLRGPARRVWPIVTLNAARQEEVVAWLENFRTRIFGHMANRHIAQALGADKTSALDLLVPHVQFSLRENDNWLRFWLPSF
jgi:NACHT domain